LENPHGKERTFVGGLFGRLEIIALCLVLLIALVLRLGDFNEPWPSDGWQYLGAFFATTARNFVEHGYMACRFAPALDVIPPGDGNWTVYMHHPPLFPLLVSVSFQAFGIHEWSARLVAVAASMIELLMIWMITRLLFGRKAAMAAVLLGATIQMTAFYGSFVCQNGTVLMAFCCTALFFHYRNLIRPSRRDFAFFLGAFIAAALTDWHGYMLGGAILVHLLFYGRWRGALLVGGMALAAFSLHMLHTLWATGSLSGDFGGSMVEAFFRRTWGGIIQEGRT